jgi:hypothetical protein
VTFGIIAGIALSSVVSSSLVLNGLADNAISSLAQLDPSQVCIDKSDVLLLHYLSTEFGIPIGAGSTLGAVTLASSADCFDALAANTVIKAVVSDKTVLDWVSVNLYATSGFYVSDVIYKQYLTWAFPSNSAARPSSQTALLTMFTNVTWISSRKGLEAAWFVSPTYQAATPTTQVYLPTVWSTIGLGGLILAWGLIRQVYQTRRGSAAATAEEAQACGPEVVAQPVRQLADDVARIAARGAEVQASLEEWSARMGDDKAVQFLWQAQQTAMSALTRRSAALAEELTQLSVGVSNTARVAQERLVPVDGGAQKGVTLI